MAEEYNVQAIMHTLNEKTEMDPDQHDGCYELMRETIAAYSKLNDFSVIDYKDLTRISKLNTLTSQKKSFEILKNSFMLFLVMRSMRMRWNS